ncbi:MAG: hypothetical protein ACYTXY_32665, partial [Nostoc sp.]
MREAKNPTCFRRDYEPEKTTLYRFLSAPFGEVKSRGIELDIAGQISSGWKVIASGYLNDAYVSEDS